MYLSIWDSNTYCFDTKLLFKMVLCVFIERETHNFILKFREIFLGKETLLREVWWRSVFLLNSCDVSRKKLVFCDSKVFVFISEGFEDIS